MYSNIPEDALCCAYLRKSREDEERERNGKGDTLERHRKIVERMARDNGHKVSEVYEEVVSGETIAARPQMKRLLRDLADGRWDAVYVVEPSRLGRGGGSDQEKIVNAFRYTGTWLVSEFQAFDPENQGDMRQLKRELRSSEDELESISNRLRRGKYESAKEGRWQATGHDPFGWKSVRIGGAWQLRPDDRHGDLLRIYDMLDGGMTYVGVSEAFNREGVPTKRGGAKWRPSTIRQIALNPVNAGYIRYGLRKTERVFDPDTFEVRKVMRKCDSPVLVKGLHYGTGGVSEDKFKRVYLMIVNSARVRGDYGVKNPLAGILRCGKCGYAMVFHSCDGRPYYTHMGRDRMLRDCDMPRGAAYGDLVEAFTDALKRTVEDVEMRSSDDSRESREEEVRRVEAAIGRAEAAKEKAMQAFEAGVYSIEELRERKGDADARIAELEAQLECADDHERDEEIVANVRELIAMMADDDVEPKAKNDFIKTFIKSVEYYNDTPPYVRPNVIRLVINFV